MQKEIKIEIPQKAAYILDRLEATGHEAYVVGGCVRDAILGRVPGDWDITTSALPAEIKEQFHATLDTGIQHGTVTVIIDKEPFEVTTYRLDGDYVDGRHPTEVSFTSSLSEDLLRRDFTINAMAYHPERGLVDLYGGIEDLREKRIRCVGRAEERFHEDALRILRALRFASQLDFEIEEETFKAIGKLAPNLKKISAERIQKELTLLLLGKSCGKMRLVAESGVADIVLPELAVCMGEIQKNPHHIYSVGEHCIHTLEEMAGLDQAYSKKERAVLRWSALLHDIGKPQVRTVDEQGIDHFGGHAKISTELAGKLMHRLRFDNYTCDMVKHLVYFHDYPFELTPKAMRHAMHRIGEDQIPYVFLLNQADILSQNPEYLAEKEEHLRQARALYGEIKAAGNATSVKKLKISGQDLISAGIPQGKRIGEILSELLELVLDEPERNEKVWLLDYVKEKLM